MGSMEKAFPRLKNRHISGLSTVIIVLLVFLIYSVYWIRVIKSPDEIIIIDDGTESILLPGHNGYKQIVKLANDSINKNSFLLANESNFTKIMNENFGNQKDAGSEGIRNAPMSRLTQIRFIYYKNQILIMLKRGFTPGTYKEIVFNNLVKDSINGKPVATFLYSDKYSYAIASIKDGMKLMEYARKAEK